MFIFKRVLPVLLPFILSACGYMAVENRLENVNKLTGSAAWEKQVIETSKFSLVAFAPRQLNSVKVLRVYIEGDGFAWQNRRQPSANPTPVNPVALKLALNDPVASVYLARPCQYVTKEHARGCNSQFWTDARFSKQVIHATNQAINSLMRKYNAKSLQLVGFSGGATVAALVAAERNDVDWLLTVAGNMDHAYWSRIHALSPLQASLNPPDFAHELADTRQIHLVGSDDRIVPITVLQSYLQHFALEKGHTTHIMPGYDHHCCWDENWPDLLQRFLQVLR